MHVASFHYREIPILKVEHDITTTIVQMCHQERCPLMYPFRTKKVNETTGDSHQWRNVLKYWLRYDSVKCANIIPYAWNSTKMARMLYYDGQATSKWSNEHS